MLKLLVKKQLTEIFRAYIYDAKKNRARSKAATVGYIIFFVLLMVGVIGGMFTVLSLTMCRSMAEAGMSWFYFAIMGLMAILLGAFGSVFTTYSSLYLPKDNDQMLSLPIPVDTLIAARLLGVYLMGLMYSGVVVLPAIIVYWATVSAAPLHLLAGVLFLLLISLFVMAISCLLGWVVAKVSLKLKNKSFVTVVLSLVFFGLYYYFFSFKANSLLTELLQNIALYGGKVRSSAYPVYLFGQAGAGDPLSMLLLTAAIAVLDVMEREKLVENAADTGEYLLGELRKADGPKEIRGRGLMIGIEIDGSGAEFRKKLLFGKHVFTGGAGASTVRLLPALCLTRELADRFLDAFDATLRGK